MQPRAAVASLLAVLLGLGLSAACASHPPVSEGGGSAGAGDAPWSTGSNHDGGVDGFGINVTPSTGCVCPMHLPGLTVDVPCGYVLCSSFGNQLCVDAGSAVPVADCAEPDAGVEGGVDAGTDGGRIVYR